MNQPMTTLALLPNLGWPELMIVGIVMLLLFGRRLPEVGRSLGQGIVQFKKGLKDIGDEIETESRRAEAEPKQFDAAQPPVTASGEDVRVSQADPIELQPDAGQTKPAGP